MEGRRRRASSARSAGTSAAPFRLRSWFHAGLQLVLVLAALQCLTVALGTDDTRRGVLMAAAAGLMLALAFWIKMVVAWTFPAIALTVLRTSRAGR